MMCIRGMVWKMARRLSQSERRWRLDEDIFQSESKSLTCIDSVRLVERLPWENVTLV